MPLAGRSSFVFDCGGALYGVSQARALEVLRVSHLTRVPAGPLHVLGVLAHRDELVPLVDLSALRGGVVGSYRRALLVRLGDEPLAIGLTRAIGIASTAVAGAIESSGAMAPFLSGPWSCDFGDFFEVELDVLAAVLLAGEAPGAASGLGGGVEPRDASWLGPGGL